MNTLAIKMIEDHMISDYGKKRWNKMPLNEQLNAISVHTENYLRTIDILKDRNHERR